MAGTRMQTYLRFGRDALRPGGLAPAARALARKTWSGTEAIGLGRDLRRPHEAPAAVVPIGIRRMTGADAPAILDAGAAQGPAENWECRSRRLLLESGIGRPFVAVTADDEPCYVQWLFGVDDNDDVARFFGGIFPVLEPGDALLEGAYTPTAHRGKKIMSRAMSLIAERADEVDAHHVLTFVGVDNPASLKGCARAGFADELERRVEMRFGRRRITFQPVPTAPAVPTPRTPTAAPVDRRARR